MPAPPKPNPLWKLFALTAIGNFFLTMPIIVLFFESNGLSLFQIFTIQAVYAATIVFAEVPTGYFSDRFGRRASLILFSLFFALGAIVYATFRSFEAFLVAEFLYGWATGFMSGTDSAFLYEELKQVGNETQYRKHEGTLELTARVSYAIASILGGILAAISIDWPFYGRVIISLLAIPIALSLPNSKPKLAGSLCEHARDMTNTVKWSLIENKTVRGLIWYSGVSGCVITAAIFLFQPYFVLAGVPIALFGILWAAYNLMTGIGGQFSDELEQLVTAKKLFWVLSIGTAISLFMFGWFIGLWVLLFGFVIQFLRGIRRVSIKHYLHQQIQSDKRATVLSIDSMLSELLFVIAAPIIGWIADAYGIQSGFWALGLFVILTAIAVIPTVTRHLWKTNVQ